MVSKNQLKNPQKNEIRIDEKKLKKIINSDSFYSKLTTSSGKDFFYFHEYGDYLKGQLLGKKSNSHIGRSASYKIRVEEMRRDGVEVPVSEDQVEEFFGNRHLQRVIDKNELIGSTVRIVYIGRQKSDYGHSAKIFDVFKVIGVISEKESYQDGSKRKYKKRARTKPKSGAARIREAEGRTH